MVIIIVEKKDTGLLAYVLNQAILRSEEESDSTDRVSGEKKFLEVDGWDTRPYCRNCNDD